MHIVIIFLQVRVVPGDLGSADTSFPCVLAWMEQELHIGPETFNISCDFISLFSYVGLH